MDYTTNQSYAIALGSQHNKEPVKVEACAGSGKTSTLKGIADARDDRGLYVAFNRSIKEEAARKFPHTVRCSTSHGLAFNSVGRKYSYRLNGRLTPKAMAEQFDVLGVGEFRPVSVAAFALQTVTRFCNSSDSDLALSHTPEAVRLHAELDQPVYDLAHDIWGCLCDPSSDVPVTHDFYLKLWAMSHPRINADYILFDEAQDANPCILDVVMRQKCKVVYVGDRHQQIYEWRGAINAMADIRTPNEAVLDKSFRFGPNIAAVANDVLEHMCDSDMRIKGNHDVVPEVLAPDVWLYRTNSGMLHRVLGFCKDGVSPYVVGGVQELSRLVEGASLLRDGRHSYAPELAAFKTWVDLVEHSETEYGRNMRLLVDVVRSGRCREVGRALNNIKWNTAAQSDVILSTAHKAKGLEWESVAIGDDFSEDDGNLLYVATTRAKRHLDVEHCPVLRDLCYI